MTVENQAMVSEKLRQYENASGAESVALGNELNSLLGKLNCTECAELLIAALEAAKPQGNAQKFAATELYTIVSRANVTTAKRCEWRIALVKHLEDKNLLIRNLKVMAAIAKRRSTAIELIQKLFAAVVEYAPVSSRLGHKSAWRLWKISLEGCDEAMKQKYQKLAQSRMRERELAKSKKLYSHPANMQ